MFIYLGHLISQKIVRKLLTERPAQNIQKFDVLIL